MSLRTSGRYYMTQRSKTYANKVAIGEMTHAERRCVIVRIHLHGSVEKETRDGNGHGRREDERGSAEGDGGFSDDDGGGEDAFKRVAGEVGKEVAGDGERYLAGSVGAEKQGNGVGGDGGSQDLGVGEGDAVFLSGSGAEEREETGGRGETDEVGKREIGGEEQDRLGELEGEPERGGGRGGLRGSHVEQHGRKRVCE